MTLNLKTALLSLAAITGIASPLAAATSQTPDMYVVVFRAEWCGPCQILEPRLEKAMKKLADPKIEYVEIDISNQALSERGAHAAFDRNIVSQYNQWLGITGFAVMIDADTKRTLGCINRTYDTGAMTMHIRNLKTYALANETAFDITCPPANTR